MIFFKVLLSEAEDVLPADIEITELNYDFFSPLSTDCARPLLLYANGCASDHRRRTVHSQGRMAVVPLSIDPLEYHPTHHASSSAKSSPRKPVAKKNTKQKEIRVPSRKRPKTRMKWIQVTPTSISYQDFWTLLRIALSIVAGKF